MSAVLELEIDEPEAKAEPVIEQKAGPPVGVFSGITNEEYHRGKGISKSGLDKIARSPAHYRYAKDHPEPDTRDTKVGHAFHTLVLEPHEFSRKYIRAKYDEFRTQEAKEWRAMIEAEGKFVLRTNSTDPERKPSEWDFIHRMADAVISHPIASVLLDPDQGPVEQSAYWVDPETRKLCKCRPDKWNDAHRVLVDLKSTMDASYTGFGKACANYRYHVQAAYYLDGWFRATGSPARAFVFAAVEKEPPYAVACYRLDAEEIETGREMYRRDLDVYAQCHESGEWLGYDESIRVLRMPTWGLRADIS